MVDGESVSRQGSVEVVGRRVDSEAFEVEMGRVEVVMVMAIVTVIVEEVDEGEEGKGVGEEVGNEGWVELEEEVVSVEGIEDEVEELEIEAELLAIAAFEIPETTLESTGPGNSYGWIYVLAKT